MVVQLRKGLICETLWTLWIWKCSLTATIFSNINTNTQFQTFVLSVYSVNSTMCCKLKNVFFGKQNLQNKQVTLWNNKRFKSEINYINQSFFFHSTSVAFLCSLTLSFWLPVYITLLCVFLSCISSVYITPCCLPLQLSLPSTLLFFYHSFPIFHPPVSPS